MVREFTYIHRPCQIGLDHRIVGWGTRMRDDASWRPDEKPESFADMLRRFRNQAGLTQEQLGTRARVGGRTISDLERGKSGKPHKNTAEALERTLNEALIAARHPWTDHERRAFRDLAHRRLAFGGTDRPARSAVDDVVAPAQSTADGVVAPAHRPPPPWTLAPLLPFVGRQATDKDPTDDIVTDIKGHLTHTARSRGLLVVQGALGIGKTRIVAEAGRGASDAGVQVLTGREYPTRGHPFGSVARAMEAHVRRTPPRRQREELQGCGWLAAVFPDLTLPVPAPKGARIPFEDRLNPTPPPPAVDPGDAERCDAIIEAIRLYLDHIAGPGGTALVLDDLHWASPDTLDLIGRLLDGDSLGSHRPLRVVATYDGERIPVGGLLRKFMDRTLHDAIFVGPLPDKSARALLDAALGDRGDTVDDTVREWIMRTADGVPLAIDLYAHALRAGILRVGHIAGWPKDIVEIAKELILDLPPLETWLLDIAASAGQPIPPGPRSPKHDEWSAEMIDAALDRLGAARLVGRDDMGRFWPAHEALRLAILPSARASFWSARWDQGPQHPVFPWDQGPQHPVFPIDMPFLYNDPDDLEPIWSPTSLPYHVQDAATRGIPVPDGADHAVLIDEGMRARRWVANTCAVMCAPAMTRMYR